MYFASDNLTAAVQKVLQGKGRQEQTKFLAFRGQYERCVADDGRVVKGKPATIGEMWQ